MRYGKIISDMINDNNNNIYNNSLCNFDDAYSLSNRVFTHNDLLMMLNSGNIQEKQIAAIKFDCINDEIDAMALLNNLTGCDGKIREAVAFKINLLLNTYDSSRNIFANISAKTFADATIDINANICRLIIDSAELLKNYEKFSNEYTAHILKYTIAALNELGKFIFRDKKYTINKQLFKLYWCLEAINIFVDYIEPAKLEAILDKCINQKEYTIREKAAQILNNTDKFLPLKEQLKNDENYYVRQILNH